MGGEEALLCGEREGVGRLERPQDGVPLRLEFLACSHSDEEASRRQKMCA